MTRPLAIPGRDEWIEPGWIRYVELVAMSHATVSNVLVAMRDVDAPRWVRLRVDASGGSWIQRRLVLWPAIVASLGTAGSMVPSSQPERDGDGWLIVRVRSQGAGAGSRIDVSGDLDGPMEEALSTMLRGVDAVVRRRWQAIPPARLRASRSDTPPTMRRRLPIRRTPPA